MHLVLSRHLLILLSWVFHFLPAVKLPPQSVRLHPGDLPLRLKPYLALEPSCVAVLTAETGHPTKGDLREERFILVHGLRIQSNLVGTEKQEAAGYIVPRMINAETHHPWATPPFSLPPQSCRFQRWTCRMQCLPCWIWGLGFSCCSLLTPPPFFYEWVCLH